MVGPKPIFVVHKKPADSADAFSATLFSGAKYNYQKPEEWQTLVDFFLGELPMIKNTLGEKEVPLIWTADFILDWDENKKDVFILGEINCSCVGFTSQLDMGIQEAVAEEAIAQCLRWSHEVYNFTHHITILKLISLFLLLTLVVVAAVLLVSEVFPLLKNTVGIGFIKILSAVVFDLFSFAIQKDQFWDSSNVIKFFKSWDPLIREWKTYPRHLFSESVILFFNFIESDIDDLDLLVLQVDLLIECLEDR